MINKVEQNGWLVERKERPDGSHAVHMVRGKGAMPEDVKLFLLKHTEGRAALEAHKTRQHSYDKTPLIKRKVRKEVQARQPQEKKPK